MTCRRRRRRCSMRRVASLFGEHRAREVNCSRCLFGHFVSMRAILQHPRHSTDWHWLLTMVSITVWVLFDREAGGSELCWKLFGRLVGWSSYYWHRVEFPACRLEKLVGKTLSIVMAFFAILVLSGSRDMFVLEFQHERMDSALLLIKISCERRTLLQDFINYRVFAIKKLWFI